MPEAMELATALSSAVLKPPPRLMLATAGRMALAVTQSMPWTMSVVVPLPAQLSTRTPTIRTPLATPYCDPPTVPATCVPCPWQSVESLSSLDGVAAVARAPAEVVWLIRIPVSMM